MNFEELSMRLIRVVDLILLFENSLIGR